MEVLSARLLVPEPLEARSATPRSFVEEQAGSGSHMALVGNASATTYTVTHNLGTQSVVMSAWSVSSGLMLPAAPTIIDNNRVRVTFVDPPGNNNARVVILAVGGATGLGDGISRQEFAEQGPSGRLLAEATSTGRTTGVGTNATDINGLSVDFTVSSRPVLVETFLPWVTVSNAGAGGVISITDLGGDPKGMSGAMTPVVNGLITLRAEERITTPGTYTRKVRVQRWGSAGTVSVGFDPPSPAATARLSVVEQ